MRYKLTLAVLLSLFLFAVIVLAMPDTTPVPATNTKGGVDVVIPAHAVEVAPGVFSLGTATLADGRIAEGYAVFHHRDGHTGGPGSGTTSTCFAYLANGAKWKSLEAWVMNTANLAGTADAGNGTIVPVSLDNASLFSLTGSSVQKWEGASATDILGAGNTTTAALSADTATPDGSNEVYFGSVDSPGAIAVTIVWGIFRGPPGQRELLEWDQVYDQADFVWSLSGEAGKMDYENIATHELGHSVGMGHPADDCTEETMYRFASAGETKKRDLHTGDIAGVDGLY